MGMTIEREGSGYRVKLSGDRDRIIARNPEEIAQAVFHYYGGGCVIHAAGSTESPCPICRVVAQKAQQRAKKLGKL